ncbi:MAG: late competence development ComFB family protein [Firmicutes bacterium]|nr:late competence development ComFB family protein [[Eubacterium] siraeum]MCM1487757.1 late competence development ComFB family protein [Bacillota bacterium]
MAILNVMEELVNNKIQEMLPDTDCCTCENCLDDARALALNKLAPKYVSTTKGELFSKLNSEKEKQYTIDLNIAVLSALEFVSNHPRHDKSEKVPYQGKK